MFQFPGCPPHAQGMGNSALPLLGSPIRIFTDQCLLAAPRDFSQLTASFIGSWRQGIHRMPLLTWLGSFWPVVNKQPSALSLLWAFILMYCSTPSFMSSSLLASVYFLPTFTFVYIQLRIYVIFIHPKMLGNHPICIGCLLLLSSVKFSKNISSAPNLC